MSWLTPNLTPLAQSLKPFPPCGTEQAATIEKIRSSMLAAIADSHGGGERAHRLELRIRHAPDVPGLWALRGELMAVLASVQGEARATGKLLQLTRLFRNVLPPGLASELDHRGHGRRHAGNDAAMTYGQQG